jgi:hypothetical protein
LLHEAFELDAAIGKTDVALERDDGFASGGGGEAETLVGQETLNMGEELGLELLVAGWIRRVTHLADRSLKKRKIIAITHQTHPVIDTIA